MLSVDSSVFKLSMDPRIRAFMECRIGTNGLSRQIDPQHDYLIIADDTIYALNEYQYQALRQMKLPQIISYAVFQQILSGQYDQLLTPEQLTRIQQIKAQQKRCSTCARKRFIKEVSDMVFSSIPKLVYKESAAPLRKYPDNAPKDMPLILSDTIKYPKQRIKRQPCFQCIQKHIGQAYITGMQAKLGYPQHIMLAYGHLAQAIQQCPEHAAVLKKLLILCLGVSKRTESAFVPLACLYACIKLYQRMSSQQLELARQPNKADQAYDIDMRKVEQGIAKLTRQSLDLMYLRLLQLDGIDMQGQHYDQKRLQWLGVMSSISQLLQSVDTVAANVVRNIRILFAATPHYMKESQLNICSLITTVLQCKATKNQSPATQCSSSEQDPVPTTQCTE